MSSIPVSNFFAPALADANLQKTILESLAPDDDRKQEDSNFELILETVNANAWAGARTRIAAMGDEVQAVILQEHRLGNDRIEEADAWLAGAGWWAVWVPA